MRCIFNEINNRGKNEMENCIICIKDKQPRKRQQSSGQQPVTQSLSIVINYKTLLFCKTTKKLIIKAKSNKKTRFKIN